MAPRRLDEMSFYALIRTIVGVAIVQGIGPDPGEGLHETVHPPVSTRKNTLKFLYPF